MRNIAKQRLWNKWCKRVILTMIQTELNQIALSISFSLKLWIIYAAEQIQYVERFIVTK